MEVIRKAAEITGRPIAVATAGRRTGDSPVLVASNAKAGRELGWVPEHSSLENIIATAWKWHRKMRGKE
jgi:UDP-glucose 4-epimerase